MFGIGFTLNSIGYFDESCRAMILVYEYFQLKQRELLNICSRPYLSESAAGSSEMDDLSWLLSDTNRRSKPFSSLRDRAKSTKERMAKMR